MSALAIREAAKSIDQARIQQDNAVYALARFLTNEIAKSNARLAPCVCGHVAMFCACGEEKQ